MAELNELEQFERLSRELLHAALQLADSQDGKTDYSQNPNQRLRQHNLLILESVINALKILFQD